MPADERIKVIFKRVYVRNDADVFGVGEFYFTASVDSQAVGDRSRVFRAVERQNIILPAARWSIVVNVRNKASLLVSFRGDDDDPVRDDFLGQIRHTLRRPYRQRTFRHSTRYFVLDWEVQLVVAGRFGRHPADAVFATRQHVGSVTATTVSGRQIRTRLEIHPVRPTPSPPPATALPVRPAFPAGAPAAATNTAAATIRPNDPINSVPNPSVIPVLSPPTAQPMGPHSLQGLDQAYWANARNCAKIEYSWYRPNSLAFTDDDARLEWTAVAVSGGATVAFLGPARGRRVMVYGTRAGEVRLEVRFQGALIATYRALVQSVKLVPCRFTIWNGRTRWPRATPAQVQTHLQIANRFLRQMGVELRLDSNNTPRHGAVRTNIAGIFRMQRCSRRHTFRISLSGFAFATRRNFRNNVMNFAYIHSDRGGGLGGADDYPASNAGGSITDSGSPSTSWIRPTGVGIGADATTGTTTMTLLAARRRAGAAFASLVSMYVTDANGDPGVLASQQSYAGTIAHEFGHNLNLGHRVDTPGTGFADGLTHPPNENVMHWNNPTTLAQDFDIIQARAVHQSPIVVAAPTLAAPGP